MFKPKITLEKHVHDKLRVAAEILGCSIDELAQKVLLTEADRILSTTASKEISASDVDDITEKLKGLGYLE